MVEGRKRKSCHSDHWLKPAERRACIAFDLGRRKDSLDTYVTDGP